MFGIFHRRYIVTYFDNELCQPLFKKVSFFSLLYRMFEELFIFLKKNPQFEQLFGILMH